MPEKRMTPATSSATERTSESGLFYTVLLFFFNFRFRLWWARPRITLARVSTLAGSVAAEVARCNMCQLSATRRLRLLLDTIARDEENTSLMTLGMSSPARGKAAWQRAEIARIPARSRGASAAERSEREDKLCSQSNVSPKTLPTLLD